MVSHPEILLKMITTFPIGSEDLILCCIDALVEKDGLTSDLLTRIKQMFVLRNLDVRFLKIIITELPKASNYLFYNFLYEF